jgi:predicted metal-binding protein
MGSRGGRGGGGRRRREVGRRVRRKERRSGGCLLLAVCFLLQPTCDYIYVRRWLVKVKCKLLL